MVFLHAASAAGVRGGWRSGFRRVQRSSLDLANCRNCDGDPVRCAGDSQKSGISSVHHCTCDGLRFLLVRRVDAQLQFDRIGLIPSLRVAAACASYQVRRRMTAVESMRSAVAWQCGASSLIWKEFRQAAPFCLKLWVVGLITVLLARISNNLKRLDDNWVAIIGLTLVAVAPLLVGVAAVRAERREGAFRLLADHGVSPHGVTICKHLVWLLLSLTVFGILLFIDRDLLASQRVPSRTASLRDVGLAAPLGTAAFFVVLLYAMGYFAAILIPGSVAAFFVSAIALWAWFYAGARSISRHPLLVDSRSHSGHLPRRCLARAPTGWSDETHCERGAKWPRLSWSRQWRCSSALPSFASRKYRRRSSRNRFARWARR